MYFLKSANSDTENSFFKNSKMSPEKIYTAATRNRKGHFLRCTRISRPYRDRFLTLKKKTIQFFLRKRPASYFFYQMKLREVVRS